MLGLGRAPAYTVQLTSADVIAGEMACLSGSPRNADVTVLEDAEIWEVRRNVLDRLMRLPSRRRQFEAAYRDAFPRSRAAGRGFVSRPRAGAIHADRQLSAQRGSSFVRVSPGQVLFRQGEPANDLYLIRLGHVRVGVHRYNNEVRVLTRGPGTIFGEIGLLALSPADAGKSAGAGRQRANAQTLKAAGQNLLAKLFPPACAPRPARPSITLSWRDSAAPISSRWCGSSRFCGVASSSNRWRSLARPIRDFNPLVAEYVEQGLYEGQSILVLDMDLCTRCDECTKGCIHQHGTESHGLPITRLLRDGRRFGDFLIATSCRSCTDPHCMSGCPVDSIHRGKHLQIVIEDHCIGCGLCASNCPYGNIFMVPNRRRSLEIADSDEGVERRMVAQLKAATCDLCDAEGQRSAPKPQCVASCPHDAAARMTGPQLLARVTERRMRGFGANDV